VLIRGTEIEFDEDEQSRAVRTGRVGREGQEMDPKTLHLVH